MGNTVHEIGKKLDRNGRPTRSTFRGASLGLWSMCHWTWPICRWLSYHLLMTNIAMGFRWPIEIDGLPSYKMVIFHGKLLVITRGYLRWWSFTSQQLPGGIPYPHQADRDRNQHPQQLIHNCGNTGGLLISLKRLFFFVCDIQFFCWLFPHFSFFVFWIPFG